MLYLVTFSTEISCLILIYDNLPIVIIGGEILVLEIAILFEYVKGTDLLVVEEVLVWVDLMYRVIAKVGAEFSFDSKLKLLLEY